MELETFPVPVSLLYYNSHASTREFSAFFIFDVLTDASNTFLRLMKGITGLFTDSVDDSVLLLIGVLLVFCYRVFFASVLEVGIARFFMESRLYPKTSFLRSFFPFKRKRYFSIVKGMFRRELYLFFGVLRLLGE